MVTRPRRFRNRPGPNGMDSGKSRRHYLPGDIMESDLGSTGMTRTRNRPGTSPSNRRRGRPARLCAGVAIPALAALAACGGDSITREPPPGDEPGITILRVLDLGENENGGGGDALLVTDSTATGMRHVLIDAGPAGAGGADIGLVARRLVALGVETLDALILTHAHTDHFDGMSDVLDDVHVRAFYYNGQVRNFSRYTSLIVKAGTDAGSRVTVTQPIDFDLGTSAATHMRVLPPLATWLTDPNATSSEINDGSLGTRVSRGGFSLFVAGDGEVEANLNWRTNWAAETRAVTALKAGHHGANDAVFDNGSFGRSTWLEHTDPALILISANGTSHPRIRALASLIAQTPQTYCTPVHGDIEVRINDAGSNWTVSVQRNATADCVAGGDATS